MSVKNYQKFYQPLIAVNSEDFGRCFYCSCESARQDFIPPIKFIHDWQSGHLQADFISVPSCNECFDLLKNENNGTLEPRINTLKKRLAEKYKKAIRVFNHWSMEEIEEICRLKIFELLLKVSLPFDLYFFHISFTNCLTFIVLPEET